MDDERLAHSSLLERSLGVGSEIKDGTKVLLDADDVYKFESETQLESPSTLNSLGLTEELFV